MASKKAKLVVVLTGSELNGTSTIASWAGIKVPDDKWDAYAELMGGVRPLSVFFSGIQNGWFEVTEEDDDDMGPGLSDTYWSISTNDPEALRAEIHDRLVDELGLPPIRKGRPKRN